MSQQAMYTTYVDVPRQPTKEGRLLVKRKGEQWKPRYARSQVLVRWFVGSLVRWFVSVRPSVRPSVRLSVRLSVSSLTFVTPCMG